MKYLVILLEVRNGEYVHNHVCLHTTNAGNIWYAAERYAASFWGKGEREKGSSFYDSDVWWFNNEITVKMTKVTEVTEERYLWLTSVIW